MQAGLNAEGRACVTTPHRRETCSWVLLHLRNDSKRGAYFFNVSCCVQEVTCDKHFETFTYQFVILLP